MSVRQGGKTIAGSVGQYPLNEKNITNCPTNIPQDIKLELNNGTLILKAGSKVYVPNGAGVFDAVTVESDITITPTGGTGKCMICVNDTATRGNSTALSNCISGANPTIPNYGLGYNTTTNIIQRTGESGSIVINKASFSLAIVTQTDGVITSIDQVFNGFGYIGSTEFALPGVKGLIPNGRNADGSLKSIETIISTPQIMTMESYMAGRNNAPLCLFSNGNLGGMDIDARRWGTVEKLQDIPRTANEYSCWYCLEDNFIHLFSGSGVESISQRAFIGSFNTDSYNKITSFTPKTVFHAVDYNEADFVVSFQRPTAANNYTWYRKYKSGWVEQGGQDVAGSGITYVTLPVQMANTAYTATGAILYSGTSEGTLGFQFIKHTFELGIGARWNGLFNNGLGVDWQVCGMAAN